MSCDLYFLERRIGNEWIQNLLIVAAWAVWAAISAAVLLRLGLFRGAALVRSPGRYSRLSVSQAAGVFLLYIGLVILAAKLLEPLQPWMDRVAPVKVEGIDLYTVVVDSLGKLLAVAGAVVLASRLSADGLRGFGLHPRQLVKGVGWGLLGFFLAMPWILFVAQVTGMIGEWVRGGQEMPRHPVLVMLELRPAWYVTAAFAGMAVIVAPISEEMFFRGLLQTALLRMGRRWAAIRRGQTQATAPPTAAPSDPNSPIPLSYWHPDPEPAPVALSAAERWACILIPAVLFAMIHMDFSTTKPNPEVLPIIFTLAVALGYVYERTGNLWAAIVLHAAFNAANVALSM